MSDTGTEKKLIALCSLHGPNKPAMCVEYPKVDQYTPPECTYTFNGPERRGKCGCGVAACCSIPRAGGEPGGALMPAIAGGLACKYITWKEVEEPAVEKLACDACPRAGLWDLVGGPRDS